MNEDRNHNNIFWQYFILSYFSVLLNLASYLKDADFNNRINLLFTANVYLVYPALYLMPLFVFVWILNQVFSWKRHLTFWADFRPIHIYCIYILIVLGSSLIQVLLYVDYNIYRLFKMHVDNGYILNLLTTKGGFAAMELSSSSIFHFIYVILSFLALQSFLLFALLYSKKVGEIFSVFVSRQKKILFIAIMIIVFLFQGIIFGISEFRSYTPVLASAGIFPFYIKISMNSLCKTLGMKRQRIPSYSIENHENPLQYPLKPILQDPDFKHYNIVWLVAESWRADMLTPEIMPRTYAFAKKSTRFLNHYSGGNVTSEALFTMFYGLYGPYWPSFKNNTESPVLMDVLLKNKYVMHLYDSISMTYPELDKTVFSKIPENELHYKLGTQGPAWERDREQVTGLLKALDENKSGQPFFAFMFFDSPHYRYLFPPECAIRTPYAEEVDYATMDLKKNALLIKNRYINTCNHLDTQIQRVLDYLEKHSLLESTIVIIVADHGEEMMEKGHLGHACGFPEEQIHTPLVLWVPGKKPTEITKMTSHLDIPATLLKLLGVTNPPEDYSFGNDLFSDTQREYTIISDSQFLTYRNDQYKVILPMNAFGFNQIKVTTPDDREIPESQTILEQLNPKLFKLMQDMNRFRKK